MKTERILVKPSNKSLANLGTKSIQADVLSDKKHQPKV